MEDPDPLPSEEPKKKRPSRPKFCSTPKGVWNDLSRRHFDGRLPDGEEVTFRWVEDGGGGETLDAKHENASIFKDEEGKWVVELNAALKEFPEMLYLKIAHEALHCLVGLKEPHKGKKWNQEVRRLTGSGLLARIL